ncbi:hypothetical protein SISNIDRAFT_491166 [Sistotremastrum niveocremeum HHB9708]|uniref:Uncharacterized protein n=1 Tax=Sistotremastrum niveocremeum HHB9708 TaxID=1314777 RepID=A0A164N3D7_9AGAM|nr:hypothetical protein SISNIDRAFT_491166 [Sistotremastrum niveocremeum HHB9708]
MSQTPQCLQNPSAMTPEGIQLFQTHGHPNLEPPAMAPVTSGPFRPTHGPTDSPGIATSGQTRSPSPLTFMNPQNAIDTFSTMPSPVLGGQFQYSASSPQQWNSPATPTGSVYENFSSGSSSQRHFPRSSVQAQLEQSNCQLQSALSEVTRLERENRDLKAKLGELDLRFHQVLTRIASPTSHVQAAAPREGEASPLLLPLDKDRYPHVKFWDSEDFTKASSLPYQPLSDDENKVMRYAESEDGVPPTEGTARAIRKQVKAIFNQIREKKAMKGLELPASWGPMDAATKKEFQVDLYTNFPYLRLCSHHWKAERLGTSLYYGWHNDNVRTKNPLKTESSDADAVAVLQHKTIKKRRSQNDEIGPRPPKRCKSALSTSVSPSVSNVTLPMPAILSPSHIANISPLAPSPNIVVPTPTDHTSSLTLPISPQLPSQPPPPPLNPLSTQIPRRVPTPPPAFGPLPIATSSIPPDPLYGLEPRASAGLVVTPAVDEPVSFTGDDIDGDERGDEREESEEVEEDEEMEEMQPVFDPPNNHQLPSSIPTTANLASPLAAPPSSYAVSPAASSLRIPAFTSLDPQSMDLDFLSASKVPQIELTQPSSPLPIPPVADQIAPSLPTGFTLSDQLMVPGTQPVARAPTPPSSFPTPKSALASFVPPPRPPSPPPPPPPAATTLSDSNRPKPKGKNKKDDVYVPNSTKQPRNVCGIEWIAKNPGGTVGEYKEYWDSLSPEEKASYTAASRKAAKASTDA